MNLESLSRAARQGHPCEAATRENDIDALMALAMEAATAWLTVEIAGDYNGDGTFVENSPLVLKAREADEKARNTLRAALAGITQILEE
jgi:hypothetical protein